MQRARIRWTSPAMVAALVALAMVVVGGTAIAVAGTLERAAEVDETMGIYGINWGDPD
jgi:hypothetical protein